MVTETTKNRLATLIQRTYRDYSRNLKDAAPDVTQATREHVHVGDSRKPPDGNGQWSGGGLHFIGGLTSRLSREGGTLHDVLEHPNGVLQAIVTKPNWGPKEKPTKFPGGSKGAKTTEPYTLYPRGVTPLNADAEASAVFARSRMGLPGTSLDLPTTAQPQGRFSGPGTVNDNGTQRTVTIEGHFDMAGNITTHYPKR